MIKITKPEAPADAPQSKSALTRGRILSQALQLFQDKGFDQTTMRDIAAAADVATGAAYYYFRSKDDLVMAFYLQCAENNRAMLPAEISGTKDLRRRIELIITQTLDQFAPHRNFVTALFRSAVDPSSPLSPFGAETRDIRVEAIAFFRLALTDLNVAVPKEFAETLPRLLWLYQMGIMLFWIYDTSPDQQRTRRLLTGTTDLIVRALKMANLPLLGPMRRRVAAVISDLNLQAL